MATVRRCARHSTIGQHQRIREQVAEEGSPTRGSELMKQVAILAGEFGGISVGQVFVVAIFGHPIPQILPQRLLPREVGSNSLEKLVR